VFTRFPWLVAWRLAAEPAKSLRDDVLDPAKPAGIGLRAIDAGLVDRHAAAKLTPVLAEGLRRRGLGKVGKSWYVDETYIKVHGHWRYLYRAIDRNGVLVDVMFSEHRDMAAAKAFFGSAKMVTGITPDRVTTDGHDSYPRAIRTTLGEGVKHRTGRYLNNRLEQDHRGIKGRYQPIRGFKCPRSAEQFCRS